MNLRGLILHLGFDVEYVCCQFLPWDSVSKSFFGTALWPHTSRHLILKHTHRLVKIRATTTATCFQRSCRWKGKQKRSKIWRKNGIAWLGSFIISELGWVGCFPGSFPGIGATMHYIVWPKSIWNIIPIQRATNLVTLWCLCLSVPGGEQGFALLTATWCHQKCVLALRLPFQDFQDESEICEMSIV